MAITNRNGNYCYIHGITHIFRRFTAIIDSHHVLTIWKCAICGSTASPRLRKLRIEQNTVCCLACGNSMRMEVARKHNCKKLMIMKRNNSHNRAFLSRPLIENFAYSGRTSILPRQ